MAAAAAAAPSYQQALGNSPLFQQQQQRQQQQLQAQQAAAAFQSMAAPPFQSAAEAQVGLGMQRAASAHGVSPPLGNVSPGLPTPPVAQLGPL